MVSLVLGASALVWAARVLDDGGEPHDSGDEVSIAGWGCELSSTETAAAVIGPDPQQRVPALQQ